MSRALSVTKAAEADIRQSYRSYEEKQRGLGLRYLDEIEATFDRVIRNPFQYQEVETTHVTVTDDPSNGYEAVAPKFMELREQSSIGVATILRWACTLPPGASILDLGCGHGVPLSMSLIDDGFTVYGIDASPTLTAEFRRRVPSAHVACEAAENSSFFGRTFDGVLAVGLMFLLAADTQRYLMHRVSQALVPGGRFLFTAPKEACTWTDVLTGHRSLSLGSEGYRVAFTSAGLALLDEYSDGGDNHYYDVRK